MTPSDETTPASSRSLAQKRRILEAAAEVFRRRGVLAAGMREIAASAGMTVGNLYYYFENKEALLAFCQEDGLAGLDGLLDDIAASGALAEEKLRRLIVGHVVHLNEGTPGALAHLEVEGLSGERHAALLERRDAYQHRMRELLEEGISAGRFRPLDAKLAALAILGAVNWTVKWYRSGAGSSAEEVGEAFAALLVGGLLRRGEREERDGKGARE